MATTESSFGSEGRLPFRLAMLVGHYALRWQSAALTTLVGLTTANMWHGRLPLAVDIFGAILSVISVIGMMCAMFVHELSLCPLEMREAPFHDPQEAVERNRRRLRYYHNRTLAMAFVVLCSFPVIIFLAAPAASRGPALVKALLTVLAIAGLAGNIYSARVLRTHQQLALWCPWCRDDGPDDDQQVAPTPDPVVSAHR